ncbi:hypothetical protein JCM6882_004975 [Rhodosporidiobolus microsporus]
MLDRLPTELLSNILGLAAPLDFRQWGYRERTETLTSCSLVNRRLRAIAQPMLWEVVRFEGDVSGEKARKAKEHGRLARSTRMLVVLNPGSTVDSLELALTFPLERFLTCSTLPALKLLALEGCRRFEQSATLAPSLPDDLIAQLDAFQCDIESFVKARGTHAQAVPTLVHIAARHVSILPHLALPPVPCSLLVTGDLDLPRRPRCHPESLVSQFTRDFLARRAVTLDQDPSPIQALFLLSRALRPGAWHSNLDRDRDALVETCRAVKLDVRFSHEPRDALDDSAGGVWRNFVPFARALKAQQLAEADKAKASGTASTSRGAA